MGYSKEQIEQMFNTKMGSVMTRIDRARQEEETAAYNEYVLRQERMAQASLALSAIDMGLKAHDRFLTSRLAETYDEDITEDGILQKKKYEKREGWHPFKPTQKTRGYKEFLAEEEKLKTIEKIGESKHLDDPKDLVGWINPETGEQGTGAEYDKLVEKSGEEAARQQLLEEKRARISEDIPEEIQQQPISEEELLQEAKPEEDVIADALLEEKTRVPTEFEESAAAQQQQMKGLMPTPEFETEMTALTEEADLAAASELEKKTRVPILEGTAYEKMAQREQGMLTGEDLEKIISEKELDKKTSIPTDPSKTQYAQELQREGLMPTAEFETEMAQLTKEADLEELKRTQAEYELDKKTRVPTEFEKSAAAQELQRKGLMPTPAAETGLAQLTKMTDEAEAADLQRIEAELETSKITAGDELAGLREAQDIKEARMLELSKAETGAMETSVERQKLKALRALETTPGVTPEVSTDPELEKALAEMEAGVKKPSFLKKSLQTIIPGGEKGFLQKGREVGDMTASAGTSDVFAPTGEKLGDVEIPDAKPDLLKTGGKVVSGVQDVAGALGQIKTLTGEGTDEEKIIAGTKLTSSGLKAGGKLAEKAATKVAEEAGEKVGEKTLGKTLGTAGKALGATVGVYTGLKTAFSEEASDVERFGGGLQAIGSGMIGTGFGAPIGAILAAGGTLLSMFGGKKKRRPAPRRPRMDLGRFYQPSRGY